MKCTPSVYHTRALPLSYSLKHYQWWPAGSLWAASGQCFVGAAKWKPASAALRCPPVWKRHTRLYSLPLSWAQRATQPDHSLNQADKSCSSFLLVAHDHSESIHLSIAGFSKWCGLKFDHHHPSAGNWNKQVAPSSLVLDSDSPFIAHYQLASNWWALRQRRVCLAWNRKEMPCCPKADDC